MLFVCSWTNMYCNAAMRNSYNRAFRINIQTIFAIFSYTFLRIFSSPSFLGNVKGETTRNRDSAERTRFRTWTNYESCKSSRSSRTVAYFNNKRIWAGCDIITHHLYSRLILWWYSKSNFNFSIERKCRKLLLRRRLRFQNYSRRKMHLLCNWRKRKGSAKIFCFVLKKSRLTRMIFRYTS